GIVWGNFPAGGNAIAIRSNARELGAIPIENLAKLRPGAVIRFGGRRWQVRRLGRDGIDVAPAGVGGAAVDVSYGGRRPPLDPAHVGAILEFLLLDAPELHAPATTASSFRQIVERL